MIKDIRQLYHIEEVDQNAVQEIFFTTKYQCSYFAALLSPECSEADIWSNCAVNQTFIMYFKGITDEDEGKFKQVQH